jgi:hypothetical protein
MEKENINDNDKKVDSFSSVIFPTSPKTEMKKNARLYWIMIAFPFH